MKTIVSIISRRDSTLVKGILILLIILGHNGILMDKCDGMTPNQFNNYLYSFHVYLFFMLDFLYDVPQLTSFRFKHYFRKIYKPYFILILILLVLRLFQNIKQIDFYEVGMAVITANQYALKDNLGAYFPWFLPSLFTMLCLRDWILNNKKRWVKFLVFGLSLGFLFIKIFCGTHLIGNCDFFICGSYVAITYFSLGLLGRILYEKMLTYSLLFRILIIILFILSTIYYFNASQDHLFYFNAYFILPLSSFLSLLTIVQYIKDNKVVDFFLYIGKYSLPIYMIHVFIYNIVLIACKMFINDLTFGVGLLVLFLTLLFSLLIISIVIKIGCYNLVFK